MRLTLVASTAILLAACSSATDVEPEPQPTAVNPQLVSLEFVEGPSTSDLPLRLKAMLASGATLSDSEFVPVRVATSTGQETTTRFRGECSDAAEVICDRMVVMLRPGYPADSIQDLFLELGAQPYVVWRPLLNEWVSIQLFDLDLERALTEARAHRAIAWANESGGRRFDFEPIPGEPDPVSILRVAVPTAPWISGALTFSSGDSVTASYRQPDGSVLRATAVIE